MQEGWWKDDYLILFEESEISAAKDRYAISGLLPGYEILGLRGWDDFIVRDLSARTYAVPTVPLISEYLEPFPLPGEGAVLEPDPRYTGKIKWYLKPLVFGGKPDEANTAWVDHEEHAQLVRFWNTKYHQLALPNSRDAH